MNYLNPSEEKDSLHIDKQQVLNECMQELLNHVITEEMKEAYGEVWEKMAHMKNRPWLLEGCLMRIEKYWSSVFSLSLQKQCLKVVQDFRKHLLAKDKSR